MSVLRFLCIAQSCFLFVACNNNLQETESRVFNGNELRPEVHKYLVKLLITYSSNLGTGTCSGSIINSFWILSAAHCFDDNPTAVKIYHHVNTKKAIATAYSIISHWKYDKRKNIGEMFASMNILHDIALLKTSTPIKFNKHVKSIQLANKMPTVGQLGVIAGYGTTESHLSPPREGGVEINRCIEDNITVLCTIKSAYSGFGDSGGPLVVNNKIIGVVSAGDETKITFYADVFENLVWINSVMFNLEQ